MYRIVVESPLGGQLKLRRLRSTPCLPLELNELSLRYRYQETYYHVTVRRSEMDGGEELGASITVDGVAQEGPFVPLADDREEHQVEVRVASRSRVPQTSAA